MRERDERGGRELAEAKAAFDAILGVRRLMRYTRKVAIAATAPARNRRDQGWDEHLAEHAFPLTASASCATSAAPTIPPISACEEDEGKPVVVKAVDEVEGKRHDDHGAENDLFAAHGNRG